MSLEAALQTFYVEAQEHLESMESVLLQIDEGECDSELLNNIFRSAHTIKGSSGIFGLDHIVEFTHVVENILDRARENEITIEAELVNVLFKCRDHIQALVNCSFEDFQSETALQETGKELLSSLSPWAKVEISTESTTIKLPNEETQSQQVEDGDIDKNQYWHISLRLSQDCLKNGMDPLSFIKFLSTLGEIKHIETLTDNFPDLASFDPEDLYFAYEISLDSTADLEAIENTFMFVQDDSDISILPPNSKIESYIQLIDTLPEDNQRLGEILINCGALTPHSLEQALCNQNNKNSDAESPDEKLKLGELLSEKNTVDEKVISAALSKQSQNTETSKGSKQIRVDSDRLDLLINLIGELVINQQRIDILANDTTNTPLIEAVEDFENFTDQIRDAALNLRMVPIGGIFQRFKRLVRDTAQELDKDVELIIEGAETELDRLMVEKLGDPLTHIVRNAMDHGIESVVQREEAGKPGKGRLKLSAYHEAGHIVIAISDNGRGIDKNRVREKALSKGIINEETILTDNELFQLIFHPGFSTAETVTSISGRGVGMDVVKRNVESLQGNIEIESETGQGSTFKIRLPLTLAIIDGFHVESKGTHFIIPQATIIECIDLVTHVDIEGRHCINLRGDMIPYLAMNEIFNLSDTPHKVNTDATSASQRAELVIVQFGGNIAGIAVDKLNGEIQTVVKPLGPIFKPLKGIGGSSLLGSGEIAFILDIPQLIDLAVGSEIKTNNNHESQNR